MTSAQVVDVVLVALVFEALVLAIVARSSLGPSLRTLWPNLAAGLFFVLALREAVGGGRTVAIALWVLLAGAAHATDLAVRLRTRG